MTTLVRHSAPTELDPFERRFRRLFEGTIPFMTALVPPITPAADIYETDQDYGVELEVPGYEEKELGLEVSDHTLVITGTREETKAETDKAYRLHERLERAFERTFTLPPEIDEEHVTATFEKGVLKVHAPKLEAAKPRRIAISKA